MNQNQLFQRTRIRLAFYYAVVMGLIMSISAFGFYRAVFYSHVVALDNEIESVAGTLHDTIEPKLQESGKLEPTLKSLFPNLSLCEMSGAKCIQYPPNANQHFLGIGSQGNYYIRFFNLSGRMIATAGSYPEGLSTAFNNQKWQFIQDGKGINYHQITLTLHSPNGNWGYIQVGRSLFEFNQYLNSVKLVLALGLPVIMGMVAVASWWLAGLAMQPIYQSYQQIQQFTADVAHELRTPLAATQATVESALMMPQLDEIEARDILRTIHRQNLRLTSLIADLLLLSRLDRQPMPVREVCCLNEIVGDLIEEFAAMASDAKVTLTNSISIHQYVDIIGNSEQLYRLISNLIVNAIQYTPQGGKVNVIIDYNDHYAVIQVQDTGIGIPPQDLRRIFDRFYRVNSDRSRRTGGSGLGLAIAKAIVQTHYGSLNVQSELGKGSTFTIQLPLDITKVSSFLSINSN